MSKGFSNIGIKVDGKSGFVALLKILLTLRKILLSLLRIPLAVKDFLSWCKGILRAYMKIFASLSAILSVYMSVPAFYIKNGVSNI